MASDAIEESGDESDEEITARASRLAEKTAVAVDEAQSIVDAEDEWLLSHPEAEVWALIEERGLSRTDTSEELGISMLTVDEYKRRASQKIHGYYDTYEKLSDVTDLRDLYFEWSTGHEPEATLREYIETHRQVCRLIEETDGWRAVCSLFDISPSVLDTTYQERLQDVPGPNKPVCRETMEADEFERLADAEKKRWVHGYEVWHAVGPNAVVQCGDRSIEGKPTLYGQIVRGRGSVEVCGDCIDELTDEEKE